MAVRKAVLENILSSFRHPEDPLPLVRKRSELEPADFLFYLDDFLFAEQGIPFAEEASTTPIASVHPPFNSITNKQQDFTDEFVGLFAESEDVWSAGEWHSKRDDLFSGSAYTLDSNDQQSEQTIDCGGVDETCGGFGPLYSANALDLDNILNDFFQRESDLFSASPIEQSASILQTCDSSFSSALITDPNHALHLQNTFNAFPQVSTLHNDASTISPAAMESLMNSSHGVAADVFVVAQERGFDEQYTEFLLSIVCNVPDRK